ncbi:hypothetical protein [Pseudomonas sp. URMO17WK12:I12]|uniref:hypothetical protein n=1 Tax=Pseudomonas sp. URMO17WK12:I12 TaxID=1259797 RepID=UPI000489D14C|nr:hypothetical protein [Pseudomonas sp. URMO17WK12:I12]
MSPTKSTNQPLESAESRLEALDNIAGASGIPVRLLKLISLVVDHWKEEKTIEDIHSLTDAELLRSLAISGGLFASLNTRETRKISRRAVSKIEFFERLKEFGGVLKSKGVTDALGISRQSVSNHLSKKKLIAFQVGHDNYFPAFQFLDNEKLPHLEEILGLLNVTGAETICTFFLNPIAVENGRYELPYALLKNGATEKQLEAIRREAALFMTGTPS